MSRIRDKVVLVTGGCGFIGHHLIRHLLTLGPRKVLAVDDLSTGHTTSLPEDERVEFINADFSQAGAELVTAMAGTDCLFHLAAVKHRQTLDRPERCLEVNVTGTKRLFALAAEHQVEKIVYSSSLYAHGSWSAPAMSEHDLPAPNTIYGITKLAGEHLLAWFHKQTGRPYVALRYFFAYGPGQYHGLGYPSVIYKNFERMLKGEAPVVFGDGEQVLDYIFVGDLVRGTVMAMESDLGPELFHLGSGQATTVNALTGLMREIAQGPEPTYGEADPTHGSYRVANTTRAREQLGFEPQVDLKTGLEQTYRWMANRKSK